MVNNQQPELQIVLELLKAKNNRLMAKTLHFSWGEGVVIKKLVQKLQKKKSDALFSHALPISYHHGSKHLTRADGTKFKPRILVRA